MTSRVAIIPARGGSQRIPRKNVREFNGVPILTRVIALVRETGLFADVVVSTDDPEIADRAVSAGASVPGLRSPSLADNHTPVAPVIADAIDKMSAASDAQTVCVLFATAVLLRPADVADAIDKFEALEGFDHLMGVCRHPAPIERALRQLDDGSVQMERPEHRLTRSQDLAPAFYDAGQLYVSGPSVWHEIARGGEPRTYLHELPAWRVVDIDDEDDWALAERISRVLSDESSQ